MYTLYSDLNLQMVDIQDFAQNPYKQFLCVESFPDELII